MSEAIFIYARWMPRRVKLFATETVAAPKIPMTLIPPGHRKYADAQRALDYLTVFWRHSIKVLRKNPTLQEMAEKAKPPPGWEFVYIRGDGRTQSSRILVKRKDS